MTTQALITPELVTWARRRRELSAEGLASKVGVSVERVKSWEAGSDYPSWPQADHLATQLSVPIGYLFLSTPPENVVQIPDLRTTSQAAAQPLSPDFQEVLDDALRKQDWYREHLEQQNSESLTFIGQFPHDAPAALVAASIRDTLGIDSAMRDRTTSSEQFLTGLVRLAERVGVLVLRTGIVGSNTHRPLSTDEFRGFALSDSLAPLILLNSKDAKTAQAFTFAHELAHLWVGQSGVSNPNYRETNISQPNAIERHCDLIAAETLVPLTQLESEWDDQRAAADNSERLARAFRVSRFVIYRRALEAGKITTQEYRGVLPQLLAPQRAIAQESGGNYFANVLARNSPMFTSTLVAATSEGRVSRPEAASLLNIVNLATLSKFQAYLQADGS